MHVQEHSYIYNGRFLKGNDGEYGRSGRSRVRVNGKAPSKQLISNERLLEANTKDYGRVDPPPVFVKPPPRHDPGRPI